MAQIGDKRFNFFLLTDYNSTSMSKIKVVFFDLGSTLVYSNDPWPPFYEQADRELVGVLHRAGIEIDPSAFYIESGGFIRSYYDTHSEDNLEQTTFIVLRDVLSRKGFRNVPDPVLRTALEAMYAVTQQNWYLEEDAISTLETLKSRGYCLGLISNTSDDNNVQGILDRWGLRPFFATIVTSAALGIRKPDPRIFQVALDQIRVQPEDAAMVGDSLDADILGANQSGIYSIWITRRVQVSEESELAIQPQAVVTALYQIPDLLAEIEHDRA
jgi:putative hydrolase of the HAD superfamily